MSTQNRKSDTRPYRLKERARKQEETRRRITEAVVELHRTVGPAKTTVSDVADLAGVGRMTVYKHFPTESEMFQACGAHWSEDNPLPDFSDCLDADDPRDRAAAALERLYDYYRQGHDMLGKIMRDAPLLPSLQSVVDESWGPTLDSL
ncbi:MAG: TetR/AcrR family transcriptional regulator, partial [Pseudomonadales bacterium]|nr:TetR/AcrR family transcriptional regulator [Pseudomonadales bacterium]